MAQTPFDPENPWLDKIKFRPPSARNSSFVRYHVDKGKDGENIRLSKRIAYRSFKFRAKSERFAINGVVIKIYTRNQVAKLFKVTPITIMNWVQSGVMPTPFMTSEMSDGREISYWTASQCLCMAKVVDQFYKEGFRLIPWKHYPQAVELMHRAGRIGVERTKAHVDRKLKAREVKEVKKSIPKYGVLFEDD